MYLFLKELTEGALKSCRSLFHALTAQSLFLFSDNKVLGNNFFSLRPVVPKVDDGLSSLILYSMNKLIKLKHVSSTVYTRCVIILHQWARHDLTWNQLKKVLYLDLENELKSSLSNLISDIDVRRSCNTYYQSQNGNKMTETGVKEKSATTLFNT